MRGPSADHRRRPPTWLNLSLLMAKNDKMLRSVQANIRFSHNTFKLFSFFFCFFYSNVTARPVQPCAPPPLHRPLPLASMGLDSPAPAGPPTAVHGPRQPAPRRSSSGCAPVGPLPRLVLRPLPRRRPAPAASSRLPRFTATSGHTKTQSDAKAFARPHEGLRNATRRPSFFSPCIPPPNRRRRPAPMAAERCRKPAEAPASAGHDTRPREAAHRAGGGIWGTTFGYDAPNR